MHSRTITPGPSPWHRLPGWWLGRRPERWRCCCRRRLHRGARAGGEGGAEDRALRSLAKRKVASLQAAAARPPKHPPSHKGKRSSVPPAIAVAAVTASALPELTASAMALAAAWVSPFATASAMAVACAEASALRWRRWGSAKGGGQGGWGPAQEGMAGFRPGQRRASCAAQQSPDCTVVGGQGRKAGRHGRSVLVLCMAGLAGEPAPPPPLHHITPWRRGCPAPLTWPGCAAQCGPGHQGQQQERQALHA